MTKKAFNGFFAMIGLCLSLISPQALANHPTLLSNCNSFKLDSGDFVRRVDALVGKIDNLVRTDSNVQQEVKAGKDITQNVYAAGLINKIQDCNEDATNPNIQVVGGDPLKNTTGKSFTLILRALNTPHCRAIRAGIRRVGRSVRIRPEIPNKPKGQWGQCLSNPITWGMTLGKNLPMPNVAYINVEANFPATTVPSPSNAGGSCQVRQFSNVCALFRKGKANAQQKAECSTLLQGIEDTINKIHRLNAQRQLASLSIKQREALMAGLLSSTVIPEQMPDADLIVKYRLEAAERLYRSGPNNNIDSQYWTTELSKYDQISDRIYQKACANGWHHLFDTPFHWTTMFGRKRQNIIMQLLAEFQSVIPITLRGNQIYFEDISWISRIMNLNLTEAYYVPPSLPKADRLYPWRDTIVLTDWSYQAQLVMPVDFKDFIRILLEEMMHAHQRELWEDALIKGGLPNHSNACYQAHLFMYNAVLYSSSTGGAYENQPLEIHAKQFSEYVRSSLFAPGRACP
ncbi:MAG: hypothetical protein MI976_25770 [Pseudomonadales bacterium]|nr:hypothetical protein [Pseudomonadales bacterium]